MKSANTFFSATAIAATALAGSAVANTTTPTTPAHPVSAPIKQVAAPAKPSPAASTKAMTPVAQPTAGRPNAVQATSLRPGSGQTTTQANTTQGGAGPATTPPPGVTTGGGGSAGGSSGYLQYGTRNYYPQGCVHNGNHAICTFTFVNQGNMATINATPGGELWGAQFVDNGHVPHSFDSFYFVDQFGTHQNQLIVQPGNQGTLVLEFAQVDPAVTSGEYHLQNQILGGVQFGQPVNNPQIGPIPFQVNAQQQAQAAKPCDPATMGKLYCLWHDRAQQVANDVRGR